MALDVSIHAFPSFTLLCPFYILGVVYLFFGLGAKTFKPVGFILKQFVEGIATLFSAQFLAGAFRLFIAIGGALLLLMLGWIVGLFYVVKSLVEAAKDSKFIRAGSEQKVAQKDNWDSFDTAASATTPVLPASTPACPEQNEYSHTNNGSGESAVDGGWDDILGSM